MRRLLTFICEDEVCAASIDLPGAATSIGILIVSGGSEARTGVHGWQAQLAARLAAVGYTVLRFDRRGVGDSAGVDEGFESAASDLAAAAATLRREFPGVRTIIGLGNCDAATALALFGATAGLAALLLLNPWLGDAEDGKDSLPSAAAIRRRYADRLRDPATWRRLLTGGVDLRAFGRGLRKAASSTPAAPLAGRMADAIRTAALPTMAILAEHDATAITYSAAARHGGFPALATISLPIRSHSFAEPGDLDRLAAACQQAIISFGLS